MCGIVKNPTRRQDFRPSDYPNIVDAVTPIVTVCEEVAIPSEATSLVLAFADHVVGGPAKGNHFVLETLPFAYYAGGKRYVTDATVAMEALVVHLAMAGSVRHEINLALAQYGVKLEMGHCCDIQLHSTSRADEAMAASHEINVFRASALRFMSEGDVVTIDEDGFADLVREHSHTVTMIGALHRIIEGQCAAT